MIQKTILAFFSYIPRAIGILFFSFLAWLLVYLSKNHVTKLELPVVVKSTAFLSPVSISPDTVIVKIKGSGWEQLKLFFDTPTWTVPQISSSTRRLYRKVLFKNDLNSYFSSSINSSIEVIEVDPKAVDISLGRKSQISIPLVLDKKLPVKTGYIISGKISIEPDTVTINGAAVLLKNIKHWKIVSNINKPLSSGSFEFELPVKDTLSYLIEKSFSKVTVSGFTETLTEVSYSDIHVKTINLNDSEKATINPSSISLKIVGPASVIANLKKDNISAFVDKHSLLLDTSGNVVPTVTLPSSVTLKEIIPPSLKYIFQN